MDASATARWWFSGVRFAPHFVEQRPVIVDQLAFGAALRGMAEGIERRAAQEFQFRQQAEQRQQPRAEAHLARQARRLVAAGEQGRREVEFEAKIVAVEGRGHLFLERAVGVEPGHLVFVLVGHQLEQIARHRLAELGLARRAGRFGRLDRSTKVR